MQRFRPGFLSIGTAVRFPLFPAHGFFLSAPFGVFKFFSLPGSLPTLPWLQVENSSFLLATVPSQQSQVC